MKDIYIVVPTYDPDTNIMKAFIDELSQEFKNILVVNDGCNEKYNSFYKDLEKKGIEIFTHYKNYGKGRGIKNAFNYLLNKYPKMVGCITCDSDGQHSVKDIKRCAEILKKNPEKLIIGVRNFDSESVPKRSKFGNKITRVIFKTFIGLDITDTQTGLRGFSRLLMEEFADTLGERYEYETNMLIQTKEKSIDIEEFEIETIYINSNETSHFNPVKDSIKIYKQFSKYFFLSFTSYILDIVLFIIFLKMLKINTNILAATIISRSISSIYNYYLHHKLKFKNSSHELIYKYYTLSFIQMLLSGCFVTFLANIIPISVILLKVVVDLIIWVISIFIQNSFSHRRRGNYE